MSLNFTQKERMLLEDQEKHEQVCVDKYTSYANQAQDPQLKQLFQDYANQEQQHLDSIILEQLLNGQLPSMGQQNQGQNQQNNQQQFSQMQGGMVNQQAGQQASQQDAALCNDLLMTEKYVSDAYDTAIFEFTDSNVRQILNHIQKEEQQHGEGIFHYMQSKGMYNPQ